MSLAKDTNPALAEWQDTEWEDEIVFPPGDLLSDETPLETDLHLRQMLLLIFCLEWLWKDRHWQNNTSGKRQNSE
jgi:hypothetical protein